ncbi:NAD(P)/FAD-dependent oxidoreductase [Pseudooceanicola sp.]|uniref:NAD(P)/FAD-dependent oxidoreductase n=1 Tax=Pseudooceanicola sp. TaxID=1914328 RepID=UPI0035C718F6
MKYAVIGAGMIGSAAARHLAAAGQDVTLIGPGEPEDIAGHEGVFASHYDEGRITRGLDPMPFWSRASRAAIGRYGEIERASGLRFYSEVGCLMAGPEGSEKMRAIDEVAARDALSCERIDGAALRDRFPFFAFPEGSIGRFEAMGAGHISPRALVQAQIRIAVSQGAVHLAEEVTGFDEGAQNVAVRTDSRSLVFDRVLLATGGFSEALIGDALPMEVYGRTVALFALEAAEAERLRAMPSLIWQDPERDNPYLLPPIRYPDGRMYLKLGYDPEDVLLSDTAAVKQWFRSEGTPGAGDLIEGMIRDRMPGLEIAGRHVVTCVTSYTPNQLPHLKALSDRVFTAIGGCGRAAKNSDELGRLGAVILTGGALPDWAAEAG